MYQHETQIRIHYALTDQMGVVYHGHYAQFYEQARAEYIRSLGYTYKDIEAMGVIMPVVHGLVGVSLAHLAGLSDFVGKPISLQTEPTLSPEQYDIVLL